MFRIFKVASQVTYHSVRPLRFGNYSKIIGNNTIGRFYCDKKKDNELAWKKEDPCAEKPPQAQAEVFDTTCQKGVPEVTKPECPKTVAGVKPRSLGPKEVHDSVPCPDPCKPDLMPIPSEPWGPYTKAKNRRNRDVLLWGLLSLALSLAGLYYVGILGFSTITKRKQDEVEVENKIPPSIIKKKEAKRLTTFGLAGPKMRGTQRAERIFLRPPIVTKFPKDSCDIPTQVPYLLIGGGTASFAAFRAIKSSEPTAKVLVISKESDIPYMRPPLSKEMWFLDDPKAIQELRFKQWNGTERSLFYEPADFYVDAKDLLKRENGGVAIARGWTVKKIDVKNNTAILEDGHEIKYDKCLIATGASPQNLRIFDHHDVSESIKEKVTLYRNIFDFKELEEKCRLSKSIVIIGGGFLGSELACAIARYNRKRIDGFKIHQVFRESGNMGKVLPEYLSAWTTEKVRTEGVNVITNNEVEKVELCKGKDLQGYETTKLKLTLENGQTLMADQVVVAIGVKPNTELAKTSALEVDPDYGGFVVNTELAARSNLFIAGDCACFYDTKFGRRLVEHHDHAVVTGRLAGENMTGAEKPYTHQSMFWSDLGPDVGYEAIGIVDAKLATVGVFAKSTASETATVEVSSTVEVCADPSNDGKHGDEKDKCDSETIALVEGGKTKEKMIETQAADENMDDVEVYGVEVKGEDIKADVPVVVPEKSKSVAASDEFGKGVVFYLRDDIVVGIVLWNVFNRMSIARQVLKDERKYDDLNEVAKLFTIHEE